MSKRHTDITNGEVLPEGIRFYARLSSETDTSDHVSGVSPTINTSMVNWDNNFGAWKFIRTAHGQLGMTYNITDVNDYRPSYEYTAICKVYVTQQTGTCDVITIGDTGYYEGESNWNIYGGSASLLETHRFTGFTLNSWHTLAQVPVSGGNNTINLYMDGNLVRTGLYAGINPTYNALKWEVSPRKDAIVIGCGAYNYNYTAYIKEVMMFDRLLTQSEIQQYN